MERNLHYLETVSEKENAMRAHLYLLIGTVALATVIVASAARAKPDIPEEMAAADQAPALNDATIPPPDLGQSLRWEDEYRKGKNMLKAGIVLTVLGGLLVEGISLYYLLNLTVCAAGGPCLNFPLMGATIGTYVAGGVLLAVGVPLLTLGALKKSRAKKHLESLAFGGFGLAPAGPSGGFVMSVGFRF